MKTILAPVDFSGITRSVVENAVALARAVGGRVMILHVVPPAIIPGDSTAMVVDLSQVQTKEATGAAIQLSRLKEQFGGGGVDLEAVEVGGIPTVQILEQARALGADYIVMGSHGHGAIYDLLIGGTTHAILKKARCPVVVVPAPRAAAAGGSKRRGRRPAEKPGGAH
jgi:nucleotide-binding universal stress UspA family protein